MTLTAPDLSAVAALLEAEVDAEAERLYRPRFNAAPSDLCFIARESGGSRGSRPSRIVAPARWGLAGPRGELVINARSETAAGKPMFRTALAGRRCVVPADGFFEWTGPRHDRRPVWFHLRAPAVEASAPRGLFFFAGLWADEAENGGPQGRGAGAPPAFAVLTTAANALVAPVHDRMPVILDGAQAARWLAQPDESLLVQAPDALLIATEVSPRANSVANDDADCLVPASAAPPETPKRQLRLF